MKRFKLFVIFIISFLPLAAQLTTIKNGLQWVDSDGNDMQAHGYDIMRYNDTWYMIGEDRVAGGVNMYSSKNLKDWKFENKIISTSTCEQLQNGSRFIERPHLIYNKTLNRFVVWVHWEGAGYAPAEAAVFYCDAINGDYTYHKGFRPFGNMSRDDNLFVDDDGKAYFVSAANNNADLIIYELTDDYMDVKRQVVTLWRGGYREAPVIFKKDGMYYLLTSGCTGWTPNQGQYSYAKSLEGPWSDRINFGNRLTFDTQPTCVVPVVGSKETTYMYCGDRWQDPGLPESKNIFLPLNVDGTNVSLNYYESWNLNLETGEWSTAEYNNRIPKDGWTLKYVSSEEANSAVMAFDGDINTAWHTKYSGGVDVHPHELQIDLGKEYTFSGFVCTPRQDAETNGVIRNFALFVSNDGKDWGEPIAGGWMSWHTEIVFPEVSARYVKIVAYSEINDKSYASIAEIDFVTGVKATQSSIIPYYKVGEQGWNTAPDITFDMGTRFAFGPQSQGRGSWCISGPNGYISFSRDAVIEQTDILHSGKYKIMFLNQYNSISSTYLNVHVNDVNNIVKRSRIKGLVDKARAVYYSRLLNAKELLAVINEANKLAKDDEASGEELSDMEARLQKEMNAFIDINLSMAEDVSDKLTTYSNFETLQPAGWTGDALSGFGNGCGEFKENSFSFKQVIQNLPTGYYMFGVQAFYRSGINDGGYLYSCDRESMDARLYMGNKSVKIQSLYSIGYEGEGSEKGFCGDTESAASVFADSAVNYANWVTVYVSSGTSEAGIEKGVYKFDDWCCFNNFRLYYLGENPTAINEVVADDECSEDNRVYSLQGTFLGLWENVGKNLKPGIYIMNGTKFLVK